MNINRRNRFELSTSVVSILVSIVMLSACGSNGSDSDQVAGIGGTGIVSGKITGFGSVHVNGGTFDIDNSQFDVDGDTGANQDDLELGMVITLEVETENGVYTGKASKVFYDDEIEGPVSAVTPQVGTTKTITVFGQTITIDETSTLFDNTNFSDIAVNDVVEVSGFRVSPTQINATYLEETAEDVVFGFTEVELRGVIGGYNAGPPEMFVLDTVTVNTDGFTEIDVTGPLQSGLNVEVKGIIQTPTSVLAKKIEEEDDDFDDVDDISLQGVISNYVSDADFMIDGQSIDASGAQFSPASIELENGLEVEVEGDIVNGILIADELEVREGEAKLKALVNSVDLVNNRFEVSYFMVPGTVIVNVDGQTAFEDEKGASPLQNLLLGDLTPLVDFVKIEGREVINDEVTAGTVKRIDDDGYKLQGKVDGFVSPVSITVLGIVFPVDPNPVSGTEFEGYPDAGAFFTALAAEIDPEVEIEDKIFADGVADEVELE